MDIVNFIFIGAVFLGLIAIIILLIVFHRSDVRDLRDRLMARDYHDYSIGKAIQRKPVTDVEAVEKALHITPEDKAQADRLPVS